MHMLTQAPRGTKDVLPAESYRWQYLEGKMRDAAALAGFDNPKYFSTVFKKYFGVSPSKFE